MRVRELDVDDDDQVQQFWAAYEEAEGAGREFPALGPAAAGAVMLRDREHPAQPRALVGVADGEIVGVSLLYLPRLDNTHVAYLEPVVLPARRGQGFGAALMDASMRLAAQHGRTTLIVEANMALEDQPSTTGSRFLERRGFVLASMEVHRVLRMPVDSAHLDRLAQSAAPHHGDYRLLSWADRIPDELVAGFCELQKSFIGEAPIGDLDLEPENWGEDRVRANEKRALAQGRLERVTVAFDREGQMVGLSEMNANSHSLDRAWQGTTLVRPGHRGHRLGLALKVANLKGFHDEFPHVRVVHTWNSEENGPMVSINNELGFVPVEYCAEFQLKTSAGSEQP